MMTKQGRALSWTINRSQRACTITKFLRERNSLFRGLKHKYDNSENVQLEALWAVTNSG